MTTILISVLIDWGLTSDIIPPFPSFPFLSAAIVTIIPVTAPIGIAMGIAGAAYKATTTLAEAAAANVVKSGIHNHLAQILTKLWLWQQSNGCSEMASARRLGVGPSGVYREGELFLSSCPARTCSIVATERYLPEQMCPTG